MEKEAGSVGGYRYRDPAFAMARFSRTNGRATLYGSDIHHQHYITLTIGPGIVERSLGRDWYFGGAGPDYIEVAMSNAQFADLITQFDMGSGVPVTLTHFNGEGYSMPEIPSKGQVFKEEMVQRHQEILQTYSKLEKEVTELLTRDKPLNKAEKSSLMEKAKTLRRYVSETLPHLTNQYEEHMENRTAEAKIEVESFVNAKVQSLGLKSLAELALLGEKKE